MVMEQRTVPKCSIAYRPAAYRQKHTIAAVFDSETAASDTAYHGRHSAVVGLCLPARLERN